MAAFGNGFPFVTKFIRSLRGGSQPFLAQASDGLQYVVKLIDNQQGPNLLFNESAGSELYRACGLSVPEWTPLTISDSFLDNNPDCWMLSPNGRFRPATGLCFGSRFLGENGNRLLEILPGTSFRRVRNYAHFWLAWLIDVCAGQTDNRQAIFVQDSEGWLNAHFVDHGHLFGGPRAGPKKNFIASRYLDPRIYLRVPSEELLEFKRVVLTLDSDKLWKQIDLIPADWTQTSALSGFADCIQRLAKPRLVQNVLDTITDAQEQRRATEPGNSGGERKPPTAVLRPEVHDPAFGRGYSLYPACA
jgi:hypothetical protein